MYSPQFIRSATVQPADTMKTTLLFLLLLSVCRTSARRLASVAVTPSRSQYFVYENISLSCEGFSSGEWTVWRYTTKGLVMSQCGSGGWGSQTRSSCLIKTAKLHDSGVYWCESKHRDSSNAVNITVTDGSVILQSPVLPVTEGQNVTLHCKTKPPYSDLPADFYKDGSFIKNDSAGHMTIHHVSKSDEGTYKCKISSHGESPPSWLLIKDESEPATLTVFHNSSQLFVYERLALSCNHKSSFHEWKVVRFTASGKLSSCKEWGRSTTSGCSLQTAKQHDRAVYWCESPARQRSNSVDITVHDGAVILHSPVLPVTEGHEVTLRCKAKPPHSDLPAGFFKDGSFISNKPGGHMTIRHVSTSDEGLYKCNISGHGESPPSWLFVRGVTPDPQSTAPSTADPTLQLVLKLVSHLVAICPYCISTVLLVSLHRRRSKGRNPPVSMATFPSGEGDEGLDQPYDDVIAGVITEHRF